MGTQSAPAQLFYNFDLEEHVPANHMLREIDRFLDVGGDAVEAAPVLQPSWPTLDRSRIDHANARDRLCDGHPI